MPTTTLPRFATGTEVTAYIQQVKSMLLALTATDAGYKAAQQAGAHPALLADLYPYDALAVTDAILDRLEYRTTRNPVLWLRKRRVVRGLTKLSALIPKYYSFFQAPKANPDPVLQTHRHVQAERLQQLLVHAQFRFGPILDSTRHDAKILAYAIMDVLSKPDATNTVDGMAKLLFLADNAGIVAADLDTCRATYAACCREIAAIPVKRR